jgi:putative transposase
MSQVSQEGRTRYTHYSIAYHLVWIPKYRRKILVGDVEATTKKLINVSAEVIRRYITECQGK